MVSARGEADTVFVVSLQVVVAVVAVVACLPRSHQLPVFAASCVAGSVLVSTYPLFSRSDPQFASVVVDKHHDTVPNATEVYSNANLYYYVKDDPAKLAAITKRIQCKGRA